MKLVIPMAGRGSRFLQAGISTPKMMIEVGGKSLAEWALSGLSAIPRKDFVFVVLDEHVEKWGLSDFLMEKFGDEISICQIPAVTAGQACTVAAASRFFSPEEPLLIHNTDTFFRSDSLDESLRKLASGWDGFIGTFESDSPNYSYVKLGDDGLVEKVAEKKRISGMATTGLYAFSKARLFMAALDGAMGGSSTEAGEYYVAPLYNYLIGRKAKIGVDCASEMADLGTPGKIKEFLVRGRT
ncbi:MAG: NTP transferase domain-containing protein [Candidatus Micrarchaeota archaeon]|nr:NTP transferase domain-containing protein [Candidatus Micrarchaeota archaeon]